MSGSKGTANSAASTIGSGGSFIVSIAANQQPDGATTPPEFITEGSHFFFDVNPDRTGQGAEMCGVHPSVVLSTSEAISLLQTATFAPVKGEHPDKPQCTMYRAVPIPRGVAGRNLAGHILVAQLDSLPLNTMLQAITSHAQNQQTGSMPPHPPTIKVVPSHYLRAARRCAQDLLFSTPVRTPVAYRIGGYQIAPGDVLLMQQFPSYQGAPPPHRRPVASTPWVVVSSESWLNLLEIAERHSSGLRGIVRPIIAVVPLDSRPPKQDELVVDILNSQPGLPNGGHCPFHLLRTRSVGRIERHLGHLDEEYLEDVACGLRLILGLEAE